MSYFPFEVVLLKSVFLFTISEAAYFSDVHWSTAIKLSEYESFRSATILSYNVPPQSVEVSFSFQAKTSGKSCAFREVHIYLQHGSYPLVTPYNETFPPKFYTNRTDSFHVTIEKDANAVTYTLPTPRPGLWYMAAFLPKSTTDKIQPPDFDKSCMYGMFVVVDSRGYDNIEEISTNKIHNIHLSQQVASDSVLYRYMLQGDTVEYTVSITDCVVTQLDNKDHLEPSVINSTESNQTINPSYTTSSNSSSKNQKMFSSGCPVTVLLSADMLPFSDYGSATSCGNVSDCHVTISSPNVKKWNYILLEIDNSYNVSDVQFVLTFSLKECQSLKLMLPKTIYMATRGLEPTHDASQILQDDCIKMNSLGRFILDEMTFNVTFLLSEFSFIPAPLLLDNIQVPDYEVLVTDINIEGFTDNGGTLKMSASLNGTSFNHSIHHVVIYVCLLKNAIPGGKTVRPCEHGIHIVLNSSSNLIEDTVYVPYPEPGSWYLGLNSQCFDKTTMVAVRCVSLPQVDITLGISGCMEGQCGEYGVCQDYISGVNVFSSCKCFAGWRGYGCTDGTYGHSRQRELLALLLLTLSNLFFIPAIILSTYRRYFVEAAVYGYTMFFSGFYHACDASDLVYYCLMNYDVLSFSDFLGSICSFWVTMLAMADIPPRLRSFAQTLGPLGIAVGVEFKRHGVWVFAIPAGFAAIVMFSSWILQCRKRKRLYPGKKYYLFHFLPGVLLAATGLVLFAFFETEENYLYTHSVWHICMSLSIVFLLPKRHQKGIDINTNASDTTHTANTSTNTRTGIVLNSYSGMANGNVGGGNVQIDVGDNPAYEPPI